MPMTNKANLAFLI